MSIDLGAVATPANVTASRSTAVDELLGFDARWAAWQARGAAHDRAVRRKLVFAARILIVVAAVVVYALLGR
jgi:hypothetical protein